MGLIYYPFLLHQPKKNAVANHGVLKKETSIGGFKKLT